MHKVGSREELDPDFQPSAPHGVGTPYFPGDSVWQGPWRAREAHRSLGVQGFHCGVGTETELTAHVADLSLSPLGGQADTT